MSIGENTLTESETKKSFLVNTSGFPLNEATWTKMYQFCLHNFPGYAKEIIQLSQKPDFGDHCSGEKLKPMLSLNKIGPSAKLVRVQAYISSLQYNYTGTQFFAIPKHRPILRLEKIAQDMINNSLPIKCLEAVILATYLTQGHTELKRFPISFKTSVNGQKFRHVVLGICWRGYFGALGMSRREDLMFKPLTFCSLSSLIQSYITGYHGYGHIILKIKIGTVISHHPHALEKIQWDGISVSPSKADEYKWRCIVDEHSKKLNFTLLPQVRAAAVTVGRKLSHLRVGLPTENCRSLSEMSRTSRGDSHSNHLRSSTNTFYSQALSSKEPYRPKKIAAVLPFRSLTN